MGLSRGYVGTTRQTDTGPTTDQRKRRRQQSPVCDRSRPRPRRVTPGVVTVSGATLPPSRSEKRPRQPKRMGLSPRSEVPPRNPARRCVSPPGGDTTESPPRRGTVSEGRPTPEEVKPRRSRTMVTRHGPSTHTGPDPDPTPSRSFHFNPIKRRNEKGRIHWKLSTRIPFIVLWSRLPNPDLLDLHFSTSGVGDLSF